MPTTTGRDYLSAKKAKGAKLPYHIEFATGDARALYEDEDIAAVDLTDWDDEEVSDDLVISESWEGSVVRLLISENPSADITVNTTYYIKIKVTTSLSAYEDVVFLKVKITRPTTT